MPIKHGYETVLLKKQITKNQPYWLRISCALALRLFNSFAGQSFSPARVLSEINHLEQLPGSRPSLTKPEKKLGGPILGRFMHKHYTTTAHLPTNLLNQWTGPYAKKHDLLLSEIEQIIPLGTVIEDADQAHTLAGRLAHQIVLEGYHRLQRRQNMTGEWIIYYVHEGKNYYLDLAWHREAEQPNDEQALYDRLKANCAWEFPFAFE